MDLALPLTDCQTYFLFEFESEFGKISTHSMSIPSCTILENSENSDAPQLKQGWLTGTIHKKTFRLRPSKSSTQSPLVCLHLLFNVVSLKFEKSPDLQSQLKQTRKDE